MLKSAVLEKKMLRETHTLQTTYFVTFKTGFINTAIRVTDKLCFMNARNRQTQLTDVGESTRPEQLNINISLNIPS